MKSAWIGIGFSHHKVPSLSNVATRSSTGTSDTARSTNAIIARFAEPSFQLPRVCVMAPKVKARYAITLRPKRMNRAIGRLVI